MNLIRCHEQKSQSLEGFYQELAASIDPPTQELGRTMHRLIERLRGLHDSRSVWGVTSLYKLWLLAADDSSTRWFVSVLALNTTQYFIEYRIPDSESPWPRALVTGVAKSEDEAVKMIMIGMDRSEGWKGILTR